MKKTFWGFNLSSCLRYRRWGLGWGLKTKLIQCEMGLEANRSDLSKRKTYHTQRSLMSSGSGGEKPDMLFTQVADDSTSIYCPLIIFVPWWGINKLNKGVRITAAALINNATAWLDTGWMETPRASNPKWAPKETSQNELREVKRPVNNINNIQSEERGALWCFNLSFYLLLCFFAAFVELCGRFPFPRSLKQTKLSPVAEFFLPVLILI